MALDRALKIEMKVGMAVLLANCFRLAFRLHTPTSIAVTGDILGLLGGIAYVHARYLLRSRESN